MFKYNYFAFIEVPLDELSRLNGAKNERIIFKQST